MTLARFISRMVAAGACAAVMAGCGGATTGPSSTAPFSQVDLRVGDGAVAALNNALTVNYTGWIYDPTKPDLKGLQFETSLTTTPFTFTLGASQVIKGWDNGLVGMKVGGIRRLVIPPSLAYGNTRNNSIPPNATLVFDIELLSLQ